MAGLKARAKGALFRAGVAVERPTEDADLKRFFSLVEPKAVARDTIRVGGDEDGGYLIPDDLEGLGACFSAGVADCADFELAMAERGVPSHMADHSVPGPPEENPLFHFRKVFIGPRNQDPFIRLEDWVADAAPPADQDLILQMDIEGSEYAVLLDTPRDLLRRFRIIVLELHSLNALFSKGAFPYLEQVFGKLSEDFVVTHIHPNNCCGMASRGGFDIPVVLEMTLYRRDRAELTGAALTFPHPLDVISVPGTPDIPLPPCWRGEV